jgi:protein TonB
MLDQLVESRSGAGDNARRGGFLLVTMVAVFAIAFGGLLYSLFAKELGMGGEDLELSTLVAPVPVPEEAPPPPEPEQKPEQKQQPTEKTEAVLPTRAVNMARTDEPIAPDKISTAQNTVKARPQGVYQITGKDTEGVAASTGVTRGSGTGGGGGAVDNDEPPPAVKTPTPKPTPPPAPKTVSGGVVNGKAVNLVKPPYPPAARAVRASGAVNVQVTIDENGNVISASAVSGHPLLKQAAESAARSSKFSPTTLTGQKVKVTGIIVYNFTAQ